MANAAEESKKAIKLPYFHRQLSPEDTELIGDIRPKRISELGEEDIPSSSASAFASAWNSAGSFEEKVTSGATKELLLTLFSDYEHNSGVYSVSFVEVEASGESRIAVGRDKRPKFLYDYTLTISIDIKSGGPFDSIAKGSITFSDVMNDCEEDDIVASLKYTDGNEPPSAVAAMLRKVLLGDIRTVIFKKVKDSFEPQYRDKYMQ